LGKTSALRFENVKFFKKPALYALKTLNFKLTLPSLAHYHKTSQNAPRTNLVHLVMPSFSSALMHVTLFFSYMLLYIGTVSMYLIMFPLDPFIVLQCFSLRFPFSVLAPLPSFQKDDVFCMRTSFYRAVVHLNCPPFTKQWYQNALVLYSNNTVHFNMPSFHRAMVLVHLNMPSFHRAMVHLHMPSFRPQHTLLLNGTSQHALISISACLLLHKQWHISTCPPFT
jgi:hypothetical protein